MKIALNTQACNCFTSNNNISAKKNNNINDNNPITRKGETATLVKATFLGGLALGGKLLFELCDGDFLIEDAGELAGKIVNKNKKEAKGLKKVLLHAGAFGAVVAAAVCAFAILYTALNTPKIVYNSKVNNFKKGKEMDTYIQANKAERELYTQLNDKAITATDEQKENLRKNYMQLKLAKNKVPDFVNLDKKSKNNKKATF